ncbi:MAG: hypothetical protein QMD16_12010, partial [Desulfitobacteriaceae bacterium]|nr:hypothetical protein [Desulfitobacteriaceae bacterium]
NRQKIFRLLATTILTNTVSSHGRIPVTNTYPYAPVPQDSHPGGGRHGLDALSLHGLHTSNPSYTHTSQFS